MQRNRRFGAFPVDAVARLLSDLVAIPSVNPMGRPLSGPGILETALTDFLESRLRALGVHVRRDPILPGRDNLIAKYESPGASRTILFDVHQDTVPAEGMTIAPFSPTIRDGRLYGRGACDVKGSMAAMLLAFDRLVRERPKGSASVILALTVDEEFTHVGSSRLAEERPDVDLAIVAEPTRMNLVTTHKGAVRWKIDATGVACHSSTPTLGDNAIYRMARVISALEAYAIELSQSEPDPILGPPSLSVGRIEGGQSVNIVPDLCTIEVDRRVIPRENAEHVPKLASDFLRERLGTLDGLEFRVPWVKMPALSSSITSQDLATIASVIRAVTGREPATMGVPFGTDAGPLGQAGIPCVVLGPGDIAQAHTKDEWIDLEEVRAAAEVYFQLARALG